jgi:hypothetical protein
MLQIVSNFLMRLGKSIDLIEGNSEKCLDGRQLLETRTAGFLEQLVVFEQERVVAGGEDDVLPEQTAFEELVVLVDGHEEGRQLDVGVESFDFGEVVVMEGEKGLGEEEVGLSQGVDGATDGLDVLLRLYFGGLEKVDFLG